MIIHGKERKFLLTIGASSDISELCPDGDIGKLGDVFAKASYAEQIKLTFRMAIAMNRGYEENRAFEEDGYVEDVLSEKELRSLTPDELGKLSDEVLRGFTGDMSATIEVEPEKKTE